MSNSEIIGLVFILVFYVIVGGIIAHRAYDTMICEPNYVLKYEKIVTKEALEYLSYHKLGLAWVCGMLWIFYGLFYIWSEIGMNIYEELIIDKDEEGRIAAWLF